MKPTIERVGTSAEHFFSYQAHLHISDYLLSSVTLGCALFLSKLGFSIFVNVLLYPSLNQLFSDLCFSQPAGQKVSGILHFAMAQDDTHIAIAMWNIVNNDV